MVHHPYLDTSALLKLYYPEPETEIVSEWVRKNRRPVLFTLFHELELKNAIFLKEFRKEISSKDARRILKNIDDDLKKGLLMRPLLNWGAAFAQAVKITRMSKGLGCRSLDILHVAVALSLKCSLCLTFDERQKKLFKKVRLKNVKLA